jgi:hypothetical protein
MTDQNTSREIANALFYIAEKKFDEALIKAVLLFNTTSDRLELEIRAWVFASIFEFKS